MTYKIRSLRPEMVRLRDEEHKTLYEIAGILKIEVTTVRANLIALDNYTPQTRRVFGWTEEEDEKLITARNAGLTGHELAALFPDRVHGTVLNRVHVLRSQKKVR